MKKNFVNGILTGLLGALLLFGVIGAVFIMTDNGLSNRFVKEEVIDNEGKFSKEEEVNKVVNKLSLLEGIVDTLYLEEVDEDVYADGIYKGFMASLGDPYAAYYNEEEYALLIESSTGVYHGIGSTVSQDMTTGILSIVKPFKGGPAHEAGLLPGDIIYKVEGEEVTGSDIQEVVSKMKGEAGTPVEISIIREGEDEPLDFTIVRQEINVPTIEHKMLDNNIGYIEISEFDEITITQFKDAVNELLKLGMEGLVVDVRNNPGGLLSSVVGILERLLPEGLIVYTEDKYDNRLEERAEKPDELDIPIAVLINGNSASASEIFAGALQDYERATVVGTTSYGKGIVQKVIPLQDGTAIKLTVSKYFTPKGQDIHGKGIVPDVEVELDEELRRQIEIDPEDDNQLQEAIKVVLDQIE